MTQTLDETNCSDLRLISDASAGPCVTGGARRCQAVTGGSGHRLRPESRRDWGRGEAQASVATARHSFNTE